MSNLELSFPPESYHYEEFPSLWRTNPKNTFDARVSRYSISKVCLPNDYGEGEYRPYKISVESEFYIHSTGTYYNLGAISCAPK